MNYMKAYRIFLMNTRKEYSYGRLIRYFNFYENSLSIAIRHVEFSYRILVSNSLMEYL